MKSHPRHTALKVLLAPAGLALAAAAVFAVQLGLDNDPGWGLRRYALLGAGLSLLGWVVWDQFEPLVGPRFEAALQAYLGWGPVRLWSGARAQLVRLWGWGAGRPAWLRNATWMGALACGLAYLWLFTAGTMTDWPQGSRYFDRLGNAFRAGQLHLLEAPGPELLASENPYFYLERGDIPVLWDSLFYKGKYYLYWGPFPGLLVAGMKFFYSGRIRDSFLLLVFMAGTLAAGSLLLHAIWRRFRWLPPGTLIVGQLGLLLSAPLIWLLSRPHVYEAAIAGGQFFLLAGLYLAFTGLAHARVSPTRLTLAGLSWGLAANTRVSLSLPIAFLACLVVWRLYRRFRPDWRSFIGRSVAFGLPLLAGAAILMAYNQARFGSPLDFGYRYLITGPTIPEDPSRTSSLDYAVPNAYQYLLRPLEFQGEFPYVRVAWVKNDTWPAWIDLPPDYFYTEPVASLLMAVPLTGLAVLAGFRWIWLWLNGLSPPPPPVPKADRSLFNWLMAGLAGSALLSFGVILVFINNSLRYVLDAALTTTLFSVLFLAAWRLRIRDRTVERAAWAFAWRLSAVLTPVFGVLIAITGYANAFEERNPELFSRLVDWFP